MAILGLVHSPNVLFGDGGDDTLDGGPGNDALFGGSGNNSYLFARGDGRDWIQTTSDDAQDAAVFTGAIAHDQLWFARSGDDLIISVMGEDQTVTVSGWYSVNALTRVSASDGYDVTVAGVEALVQAMSGFGPPSAGQAVLTPAQATALLPTLAATWQHAA